MSEQSKDEISYQPGAIPHSPPAWADKFGEDRFGIFAEFQVGRVTFVMRWIPPGSFNMGSPKGEDGRYDREGPQYLAHITEGFWMGETPVTQQQWSDVVEYSRIGGLKAEPSRFKGPADLPVESVNWDECVEYCQRLNKLLGEYTPNLRLPTEAEWEYACRAETQSAIYSGKLEILGENNAPALDEIAWYGGNSGLDLEVENPLDFNFPEMQYESNKAGCHRVKSKTPNSWGLYDMLGNINEWCVDEWNEDAYKHRKDGELDPYENGDSARRVFRGGSWIDVARNCRSAFRAWSRPGNRWSYLGLRLSAGRDRAPVLASAEPSGAERSEQA